MKGVYELRGAKNLGFNILWAKKGGLTWAFWVDGCSRKINGSIVTFEWYVRISVQEKSNLKHGEISEKIAWGVENSTLEV